MVDVDPAAATDGAKGARRRARVGCARGGEAARPKFELLDHLVTAVNLAPGKTDSSDFYLPPAILIPSYALRGTSRCLRETSSKSRPRFEEPRSLRGTSGEPRPARGITF